MSIPNANFRRRVTRNAVIDSIDQLMVSQEHDPRPATDVLDEVYEGDVYASNDGWYTDSELAAIRRTLSDGRAPIDVAILFGISHTEARRLAAEINSGE